MNARTLGMILLCGVLTACNSKPADEGATSATATDSAAQTTAPVATTPVAMEPAPEGLPSRIAREVISASGQACANVAKATRADDGTITASCSSGESYRVYTAPGKGAVATPQ